MNEFYKFKVCSIPNIEPACTKQDNGFSSFINKYNFLFDWQGWKREIVLCSCFIDHERELGSHRAVGSREEDRLCLKNWEHLGTMG